MMMRPMKHYHGLEVRIGSQLLPRVGLLKTCDPGRSGAMKEFLGSLASDFQLRQKAAIT